MNKKKIQNFMQSGLLTGVLILSLLLLTACAANSEYDQDDDTISQESLETTETESSEETESSTEKIVSEDEDVFDDDYDRERALAAYTEALTQLSEDLVFPNGDEADFDSYYDMSENQFAVYDVDMDGRDELIILYTTSSMAGMSGCVYDYDEASDSLYLELSEFPGLRFYDNQVLEADWSHNQGYAGDFWPYNLYAYDSENDIYQNTLHTDAWDRSLGEVDYNGNAFPEEADVDGDGIVYYLLQPGEYDYHDPIDWDDYESWHNTAVGNEIEVPYMDLTPENITAAR